MNTDLSSSSTMQVCSNNADYALAYDFILKMDTFMLETKTAQNARCKISHAWLPVTKFIFLGTPPTSYDRKTDKLKTYFYYLELINKML